MNLQDKYIASVFTALLCTSLISYGVITINKLFAIPMTIWPVWYLGLISGLGLLFLGIAYLLLTLIKPGEE